MSYQLNPDKELEVDLTKSLKLKKSSESADLEQIYTVRSLLGLFFYKGFSMSFLKHSPGESLQEVGLMAQDCFKEKDS